MSKHKNKPKKINKPVEEAVNPIVFNCNALSDKFLEPEEMKQIMLGYLEQLPETGASEENWKAYFCDKLGYDFDTLC